MGRLNRGPNGPFSGKARSFIGSSWRGIYYIKGLQKKINYPAVVFTLGNLTLPEDMKMELNGMTLKLSWNTATDNHHSFANDQIMLLIYHPKLNNFQHVLQEISRSQGETELELHAISKGDTLQVYIYLLKKNGKKWSNSLFLGSLEVEE